MHRSTGYELYTEQIRFPRRRILLPLSASDHQNSSSAATLTIVAVSDLSLLQYFLPASHVDTIAERGGVARVQ